LAGFSITDHDSAEGQSEARTLADRHGLGFVTGLELSVYAHGREIHLLVYGYDPEHRELAERLDVFRQSRRDRARGMVEQLRTLGIALDIEQLLSEAPAGAVGRPHLARALIDAGVVRTTREAFDLYLGLGRPAYLPKLEISPEEGIALAKRAGGLAALAHPGSYPYEVDLESLVAVGLEGLETTYPAWNHATTARWRAEARRYGLIESGGSDYHGELRPGIDVGAATISREMFEHLLTASA
jgi:predicted metal-dependent phosphoesterase TrpH